MFHAVGLPAKAAGSRHHFTATAVGDHAPLAAHGAPSDAVAAVAAVLFVATVEAVAIAFDVITTLHPPQVRRALFTSVHRVVAEGHPVGGGGGLWPLILLAARARQGQAAGFRPGGS